MNNYSLIFCLFFSFPSRLTCALVCQTQLSQQAVIEVDVVAVVAAAAGAVVAGALVAKPEVLAVVALGVATVTVGMVVVGVVVGAKVGGGVVVLRGQGRTMRLVRLLLRLMQLNQRLLLSVVVGAAEVVVQGLGRKLSPALWRIVSLMPTILVVVEGVPVGLVDEVVVVVAVAAPRLRRDCFRQQKRKKKNPSMCSKTFRYKFARGV
jgi:hypothetical protein